MKRLIATLMTLLVCFPFVGLAQQTVNVPGEATSIVDPLRQDVTLGCVTEDCSSTTDGFMLGRPLIDVDYVTNSGVVQNPGASYGLAYQVETGAHNRCDGGDRFDLACEDDNDCPTASTCVEPTTGSTQDFQALWLQAGIKVEAFNNSTTYTTDPIYQLTFNALDGANSPTNIDHASIKRNFELGFTPLVSRLPIASHYFPSISEDYYQIQRAGETGATTPGGAANTWRPHFWGFSLQGKGDYAADTSHYISKAARIPMLGGTEFQDILGVRFGWSDQSIKPQFTLKFDSNQSNEFHHVEAASWHGNDRPGTENTDDLDAHDELSDMSNLKTSVVHHVNRNTGSLQADNVRMNLNGVNVYGACESNDQDMCVGGSEAGQPCEQGSSACAGGTCSGTMPNASICITDFHCRPDTKVLYEASSGECTHGNGVDDTGTNDGICAATADGTLSGVFCDDPGTQDNCTGSELCIDIQDYYGQHASTIFGRYTEINFADANTTNGEVYNYGYCALDEGMLCFSDSHCAGADTCQRKAGSRYITNAILHENKFKLTNTGVPSYIFGRDPPSAAGVNIDNAVMERYHFDFTGATNQKLDDSAVIQVQTPSGLSNWTSNGNTTTSGKQFIINIKNQRTSADYLPILINFGNQTASTIPVLRMTGFGYDQHWELGNGRLFNAKEGATPGSINQFRVLWGAVPTAFSQGNAIAESSIAGAAGVDGGLIVLDGTDGHRFKAVAADVDIGTNSMLSATDIITTTDTSLVVTAAMLGGSMHISNNASGTDYTLPTAVAGMNACFYDINGGGDITVDAATSDLFLLDGTALSTGFAIDSPGAIGDTICIVAIDDTTWITLNRVGVWIDGGA